MMKSGLARKLSMLFLLAAFNAPLAVSAASLPGKIVSCDGVNCSVCDIATTAQNLLSAGIYVLVFLAAVLFAWAGWKMLTAGGDSEGYAQGKSIFVNVLIGLIIVLAGWIVVDTLMKTMVNQGGAIGPWNKIC